VVLLKEGDRRDATLGFMEFQEPQQVALQIVVPVDNEKRRLSAQLSSEVLYGAGRAEEPRLQRVCDAKPPSSPITAEVHHELRTVVEVHQHLSNSALRHRLEHAVDHGTTADRKHRLRGVHGEDRKSTRLNSSHVSISYAV